MNLYNSNTWITDLDETINSLPELAELHHQKVLITGAGGLICSAVVDLLIRYNETKQGSIRILAAGRSMDKILSRFEPYSRKQYFQFLYYDAASSAALDVDCDYVIHGASNASPGKIVREPVETMLSNFCGVTELLRCIQRGNSKRLLYISSSEVYGKKQSNLPYTEDEYGYIDLLNPRNSYSIGKRAAETMCISFAEEYGIDAVIVRPGHIYGPTSSMDDNRVSSAWAFDAAAGRNIVMKSDGAQLRSYCYCLDCASAIIRLLLHGKNREAYNISNPDSIISIKKMAEILSQASGVKLIQEMATEQEAKGFNPMQNSSLNSHKLQELGWKGLFDAKTGLAHTVKVLQEIQ